MLRAEKAMREALKAQSLGDVAQAFGRKAPAAFWTSLRSWLDPDDQPRTEPTRKSKGRRTR
jgi:hypothetical protein